MWRHGGKSEQVKVELLVEIQRRKSECFICLVDGSGKRLVYKLIIDSGFLYFAGRQRLQEKHLFVSSIFHISSLRMRMLAVVLTTFFYFFCSSAIKHCMVSLSL